MEKGAQAPFFMEGKSNASLSICAGVQRVLALHPQVCGLESADATLWICLWGYQAAEPADRTQGEIHPYYPASQRAYLAARQAVAEGEKRGCTCDRIPSFD